MRAFVPVEEAETVPMGPLPGAVRLLDTLPERSWAVATSGVRRIATARLRRAGLPVPPVLVCAEDVTRGKPSPTPICSRPATRRLPPDCLVVEDAPAGEPRVSPDVMRVRKARALRTSLRSSPAPRAFA